MKFRFSLSKISSSLLGACAVVASSLPSVNFAQGYAKGDPETVVQIGLGSLRKITQRVEPRLPSDYGEQVTQLIANHADEIKKCILDSNFESYETKLLIDVSSEGAARVAAEQPSLKPRNPDKCLSETLMKLSYPPHPLAAESVRITLPVQYQKEVL